MAIKQIQVVFVPKISDKEQNKWLIGLLAHAGAKNEIQNKIEVIFRFVQSGQVGLVQLELSLARFKTNDSYMIITYIFSFICQYMIWIFMFLTFIYNI